MDGFSLVGGLGSLIVAGFCYSAYRNMQDVASHLRGAETLDVGDDLFEKIKTAPNHTLEYVAIRGKAKALESALPSNNVPAAKLLIQRTTVYEHKAEWIRASKLWHDTKSLLSETVNHVSFSLNSSNSYHRVIVDEPLSTSGLEYDRVYNNYEPLKSSSMSESLIQWATGGVTKGFQTVEDGLPEGTSLTAVGKVTLRSGILKIKNPEGYEYVLSKLPLEGIIQDKTKSVRRWKYVTVGFAVTGGLLLLIWYFKRRWRRSGRVVGNSDALDLVNCEWFDENISLQGEEQPCVICLTQRRNVVILDCGHICACRSCAMRVDICPICRARIVRLVPTYQSGCSFE